MRGAPLALRCQGAHGPTAVLQLMGVRGSLADPRSARHGEERLEERGVERDHTPIHRWVLQEGPLLEDAFH